jgi:hypothetical protein
MSEKKCTSAAEARAKDLARYRGHRDIDAIIICIDGERVPVWKFYISDATLEVELEELFPGRATC